MRALIVIGTRPEAIKMAPVVRALLAIPGRFSRVAVCLSGQHRELTDEVVRRFSLPVHHDLNLMKPGQTPQQVLAACVAGIGGVIAAERPDWVLFHGDTVTALATALAAFYERVPSAHVEAGLRTGTLESPFPEEMHRVVADRVCSMCFAPTPLARDCLCREGIPLDRVLVTGNTVVDAIRMASQIAADAPWPEGVAEAVASGKRLVLLTTHRRENFGEPLRNILRAARALAQRHADCCFVFPAHPNPEVRRAIEDVLTDGRDVRVVEPLEYGVFAKLLEVAALILTDSGGIQEEAAVLGIPFLVLRENTERPEALVEGLGHLVGTDTNRIMAAAESLLRKPPEKWFRENTPLGDGHAAERIAACLAGETVAPWEPPSGAGQDSVSSGGDGGQTGLKNG